MPSESLVGRAIEYLVGATVVLASDTRLNVMTAMADDEGVDLVFRRRGGNATLAVQVKGRRMASATLTGGVFQQEVGTATFRPRSDLFMLFVAVDGDEGTIERAWLIPSEDFDRLANRVRGGTKLRLRSTLDPTTRNKWKPFLLEARSLANEIEAALDGLERKP